MTKHRKKLIEVALPLEAINEEGSLRKRKAPGGYPTTLHKWWAQRPVAAARAVIFSQMVDDPSAWPEIFPTGEIQQKERDRLFEIITQLIKWDNTSNEIVLERARSEILHSWRRTCAENANHPNAQELFDPDKLPSFRDPFAGSGAIPLEAQRLGLEAHATDLNPVAVLINKATIEIPSKFAGLPPVNPISREELTRGGQWNGRRAEGLAEDVRRYGQWMRDEAENLIGHLYPKILITEVMAVDRPDLKPLIGHHLTCIAWLWARTVKSPNPAFREVGVPLASTFMLSTKSGKEAYIEPVLVEGGYRFEVKVGKPIHLESAKNGTKLGRGANFKCLMSGSPIAPEYIKAEGRAGRMDVRLMAIVVEGDRGRVYLSPTTEMECLAKQAIPSWKPETPLAPDLRALWTPPYGLVNFSDLFTPRQLTALTTFSNLIQDLRARVKSDALAAGRPDDVRPLAEGGIGATAYADAVAVYLAFAISRVADYGSSLATWRPKDSAMRSSLAKQALPMSWDFAEGSCFGESSAGFLACVEVVSKAITTSLVVTPPGQANQFDAAQPYDIAKNPFVISTDPPYYDNIGYADLADFFYVWLRPTLRSVFPLLFSTLAVPKAEELVATPYRHGGKDAAEKFFLTGMTDAMHRLAEQAHPGFPVTIYYAFKQAETASDEGTSSTGWETFLDAVIRAGFAISGTWPMRTEGDNRQVGIGANALASSIVLVCRPRAEDAPTATRRDFLINLKAELPAALAHLQRGNIAPVDLAQSAIGPGMAVYTRYGKVLDADGKAISVREALTIINEVLDEALAEQEGDFDADTRWALSWFEQMGFNDGAYGEAETLSKAKNTSVSGLVDAGVLSSKGGKVRLFRPADLPANWNPATDARRTVWEGVHHLIRVLEADGEAAAAKLVAALGHHAEVARELAYRLYTLCERKKRAAEAMSYNGLVQSWPEIVRLSREVQPETPAQATLL